MRWGMLAVGALLGEALCEPAKKVEAPAPPPAPVISVAAPAPAPVVVQDNRPQTGRFHVIEMSPIGGVRLRSTLVMVDTATGETWIQCDIDGAEWWCNMQRGAVQTTKRKVAGK